MDGAGNGQPDRASFWKKNSKAVPGRPSPKNETVRPGAKAKPSGPTSFHEFQASVSDAWELEDDDFSIIAGVHNTKISKKVSESAAISVLNEHRCSALDKVSAESSHIVSPKSPEPAKCAKIPGRPQQLRPSTSQDEDCESKLERFRALLEGTPTLAELCRLSWSGVPQKVRALTWRLLSGYQPMNQERRQAMLERKRQDYWSSVRQYYDADRDEGYQDTYHQIHIDVPRMNPTIPLFHQETVQLMFERILFIWAIRHPASGYVQGINDLVTPFFVVFLEEVLPDGRPFESCAIDALPKEVRDVIEADAFWCLSKFLDGIQDNYVFAQVGIQRKVNLLKELIHRVDETLHGHLMQHKVDYLQFSFRWLNNLLTRELPLRCTIRLWDTYLAENDGFASFQLYVCAAFLLHWREQLLQQTDFQGLMLLLQNLPTQNWTGSHIGLLVAEAYRLKVMFADAPKHLQVHDGSR